MSGTSPLLPARRGNLSRSGTITVLISHTVLIRGWIIVRCQLSRQLLGARVIPPHSHYGVSDPSPGDRTTLSRCHTKPPFTPRTLLCVRACVPVEARLFLVHPWPPVLTVVDPAWVMMRSPAIRLGYSRSTKRPDK